MTSPPSYVVLYAIIPSIYPALEIDARNLTGLYSDHEEQEQTDQISSCEILFLYSQLETYSSLFSVLCGVDMHAIGPDKKDYAKR